MSSKNPLRQVNLFIASPGDTADARNRAREAVERVNRLVAQPNGIIVHATGWEDIPSGKADRAQDRINPYVDATHVFVGILNKRFGTPTGLAESGTEEEYLRITQRWRRERPRPEVMMYFKHLSAAEIRRPNTQLQKVLKFKKKISKTDLYHEFRTVKQLGEMIETALATWIYKTRNFHAGDVSKSVTAPRRLQPSDLDVLASILQSGHLSPGHAIASISRRKAEYAVKQLRRHRLLKLSANAYKPINSTEGFLTIVKHLNTEKHSRLLLQSEYYRTMLESSLSGLIESRFHCQLSSNLAGVLRLLAQLSPSAADYLLFGDTETYDNLAEHAKAIGQNEMSQEMIVQNILQHAVLRFGIDCENGRILDKIGANAIAGHIMKMHLSVAYEDKRALQISVANPVMRAKLQGSVEKGQMLAGGPDLILHQGILMMHLDEPEFALKSFNRVLKLNAGPLTRAGAYNNMGLVYLNQGKLKEAFEAVNQAAQLAPNQPEVIENLRLIKRAMESEMPERK